MSANYTKRKKSDSNRNRKCRLELEKNYAFSNDEMGEPPTKKPKLCNKVDTKKNSIEWKNEMVLDKCCIDKLNEKISTNLSIKQYGFGVLNDSLYQSFINETMNDLQTVNGKYLKEMANIINFIKGLRAKKIMNAQIRASQIISWILKTNYFCTYFDVGNDNKLFDESDTLKWLNICNNNKIPPYMLLTHWLKKEQIFTKNKKINEWIIKIEKNKHFTSNSRFKILNNKSFLNFCLKISKNDTSCFRYEGDRKIRSENFEQEIYNKCKCKLSENGLNAKMMTEKQLLAQKSKNDKNGIKNVNNLTPDILFSDSIMINNKKIHWIEIKNYFLTHDFLWNKVKKQCIKYTKAFGDGAVICKGFQNGLKISTNTLLLDAFCHPT